MYIVIKLTMVLNNGEFLPISQAVIIVKCLELFTQISKSCNDWCYHYLVPPLHGGSNQKGNCRLL